jgi:hypothetical protein
MPNNVRPLNSEMAHQSSTVHRVIRDTHRTCEMAASCIADAMIAERAVVIGKCRLLYQRLEPVRKDSGMYQNDNIAGSVDLILKLDVVEKRPICAPACNFDPLAGVIGVQFWLCRNLDDRARGNRDFHGHTSGASPA